MKKLLLTVLPFVFCGIMQAQNRPNNCVNAIDVWRNEPFTSNTNSAGTAVDVITGDGNTVWLKINVIQSGTLGCDITPKNQKAGHTYNFWVYGPNSDCSNLGKPIRSCITKRKEISLSTNRTGMNGNTRVTQTDRTTGNGYVRWLDVTAGEFYYIRIDKPTENADFDLQWTGSAVNTENSMRNINTLAFAPPPVGVIELEATISASATAICLGDAVTITITGTPKATVIYNINGGADKTVVLDDSGTFSFSENPTVTTTVYKLTGIKMYDSTGVLLKEEDLDTEVTVTMSTLPTATISGTATICSGRTTPITFNGTPGATVTYSFGSVDQQVVLNAVSGIATIQGTTAGTYTLVRVTTPGTPGCSQNLTGSATITVLPSPTATITGTATICQGETATLTLTGTANSTVTYTINGGSEQEIELNASGNATISTTTAGIYALVRVTSTGTPACSQNLNGSATITVNPLPTATISGTATICSGETAVITFTGTANSTVTYTINGGTERQIVLNASGDGTVSATATGTYALVRVTSSGTPACSQNLNGSATVTVNPLPTATITSAGTICAGETGVITFTGTPLATVTYTVDGGSNQQITLNASGEATVSTTTASTYRLVSITGSGTPVCSQNLSGSTTITLRALPTATISGTTTICSGETAVVTFRGTPNSTVTYTINGGANQQVVLNASGDGTVSATATGIYALVRVTSSGTLACSQTLNGSATVTVNPLPTATISGTRTICSGETAVITFTGTANSTVIYTINGGAEQQVVLNAAGTGTVSTTTAGTYALVRVTSSETPACSQNLSGSAIITVNPLPTATISGTATICSGETAVITFTGTANSTVIYTINGGANQQLVLNASGTGTVSTTTAGTYALVRVTSSGTPACSKDVSGSAIITVNPLPTATLSGTTAICSGNTTVMTFTGTANAVVTYTVDGGTNQTIALNGNGTASLTTPVLTTNSVYTLVSVTGVNSCSQNLTGSATVTIMPLPTATISGTRTICSDTTATITFTGTANAVVTYTVDGGTNQTITLNGNGAASLTTPVLTTNSVYTLVSVVGANTCSQNLTGSATITVTLQLTAAISVVSPICSGSATTVAFSGTPNAVVTYTVDGGTNQEITLDANGTASLITPTLTANSVYNLVRVTLDNNCSHDVTGSAAIIIMPLPTATISGTTAICSGSTTAIAFSGTPNAVVTYTVDGGAHQTITLNANGTASLITPTLTAGSVYNLVSVTDVNTCSQNLTGSATVTIYPLLNATISGTTTICNGRTATIVFNGTAGAIVTYSVNNGASQTITLNSSGTATITSGNASVYTLLSVANQNCDRSISGMATITLTQPTAPTLTFSYDSTCVNAVESPEPITADGFTTGGTFSSTTITVNPVTGVLDLTGATVGTHTITYTVSANLENCTQGGHFDTSIVLTESSLILAIEDGCENAALLLKAVPVNGTYDPEAVTYTWKNQNDVTVGTNNASFNVDEYMAQNPTATLPQVFKVIVSDECIGTAEIAVTSNTCRMIPKGISPNNDGLNDTFDLSGMNIQELSIFNRYGREVYKSNGNYTNQWNGTSGNGNELPDGTYFYAIVKEDGEKVTGWVYINRQR